MPIKVRPQPEKPPKPPKATTTTTTTPAPGSTPHAAATVGRPTGTIPTTLTVAYGRGDPWRNVTVDAPFHERYGAQYGVDPAMLMAMEVIESGGRMIPNAGGSGAFGIMQIKASIWGGLAAKIGADLNTREGQIAVAAAILGREGRGSTPEERFLSTYYPTPCLDCKGEDGATPRQYLSDMRTLMGIIHAAEQGMTPAPEPAPQGDVLDLLFGDKPYTISATYGQLVTWSCPGCYDYFPAYGLDSQHHWAYDAAAAAGDGAPLYAPFAGTVVCAGTGVGPGAWGTGCAAFGRVNNYGGKPAGTGAGRLELLHADGARSLIAGHVLRSRVRVGQRVSAGELIGEQGGMNGSHVHVEGRYANGTKIGDPRMLFGGGRLPVMYAERVPIPQPQEFDVSATVIATRDGVPVLQRANLNAAPVRAPLAKGEDFEAVYVVLGSDGAWYWVSTRGSRIPTSGTRSALFGEVA